MKKIDSIEARFIATLQAEPKNANNRKVYADWLMEQGREKDAMYILYPADEVSIEFKKLVHSAPIEVRCPKCNTLAYTGRVALFDILCRDARCDYGNFLTFKLQEGATYKFSNGTWQWWNGINNKWWVEVDPAVEAVNHLSNQALTEAAHNTQELNGEEGSGWGLKF